MLLDHLDGILNYCRTKVRFGVAEAINGNIKTLLRGGAATKISPTCY
jgi:transposase